MKSVRFSRVVQKCGHPDTHLVLVEPGRDKLLQRAIQAKRVMTIHRTVRGANAEYGSVGFEEGGLRQYLIFPRSLAAFTNARVVGVKYELLETKPVAKSHPAVASKHAAFKHRSPEGAAEPGLLKEERPSSFAKVVNFPGSGPSQRQSPEIKNRQVEEIKLRIRHAMHVLEQGKQVAAFNLLKQIVEEKL